MAAGQDYVAFPEYGAIVPVDPPTQVDVPYTTLDDIPLEVSFEGRNVFFRVPQVAQLGSPMNVDVNRYLVDPTGARITIENFPVGPVEAMKGFLVPSGIVWVISMNPSNDDFDQDTGVYVVYAGDTRPDQLSMVGRLCDAVQTDTTVKLLVRTTRQLSVFSVGQILQSAGSSRGETRASKAIIFDKDDDRAAPLYSDTQSSARITDATFVSEDLSAKAVGKLSNVAWVEEGGLLLQGRTQNPTLPYNIDADVYLDASNLWVYRNTFVEQGKYEGEQYLRFSTGVEINNIQGVPIVNFEVYKWTFGGHLLVDQYLDDSDEWDARSVLSHTGGLVLDGPDGGAGFVGYFNGQVGENIWVTEQAPGQVVLPSPSVSRVRSMTLAKSFKTFSINP